MQSDAHGDFGARESESLRSSADQMGRNLEKSRLVPTPRPHKPLATRKVRRLQPSLDIQLSDDTEFSGSLLRRLRESADATVQDVADITKIGKRYVHAIEENDFSSLPAAVYVRGFVAEYARALGIDPLMVARSYMALYARYKNGGGEGK
ncbi:MAG: hypothetical protein A2289_21120 [Deltaproteobacteria bacterium RIFOXYA12_FULL_58_15]|nr:MAG: hypothetical protein A2289_21120 [Deltaproteobacteria bacterium RIFOXYA12_FULL_58_15]OGR09304.1 MAG: hypothetical protein A2341_10730 [Deltaproteobacteria bacterium RIFOXYB12_FULL_58_9]